MAMWSGVDLLTNGDTNTQKPGGVSRQGDSSRQYQVDTLVKISAANEVQGDPRLSSSSGSNWSIVVADETIILFDENYKTILLLLHFETTVEVFDVCHNGQFLIVCEQNGKLHLIYVPQKKILFTKTLVENKSSGNETFCYLIIEEDKASPGKYHVFLLVKDGFFHITNLALAKMETAIKTIDLGVLKELHSIIKMDFHPTTEYHDEGCSTAVLSLLGQQLHVVIGGDKENALIDWMLDSNGKMCLTHIVSSSLVPGVRKLAVVDHLVYVLDTEDVLSLWDLNVFVMINCWPDLNIHDFELTTECAAAASMVLQYGNDMKMITLIKQENSQIKSLQIRSLPSMTMCYSMTVSPISCLVRTNIKMDTFYFVEGICENSKSQGQPSSLSVSALRCFTEAQPENSNGIAKVEVLDTTDVLEDFLSHLRKGDLPEAQLLWLRHEGQMAGEFSEWKLEEVLSAIPDDLPSTDLCPWFKSVFVPFVRRVLPYGQKNLARWLEQRARDLELTEKSDWPQNGLNLAVLGVPSLWTWTKCDENYGTEEVQSLKSFVTNLRQLLDLDQKYNCKLSLSVFEKGDACSVAFFMLDRVLAPELIPHTVETCIQPYAHEHELTLDELLMQYIKDLLERCSFQTTSLFTQWEAKAVAVLDCMTDTDLMVDTVLEVMKKAVVPWSNVVEKLVQKYLEMEGPKQRLLKENYCLMEIRKLLRGYGIRNIDLTKRKIMPVVRYILVQNLPSSLEDSLAIAEAFQLPTSQIHLLHLTQLIGQGKKEECLMMLKRLPPAEAECVAERLTKWARLQLEDKEHLSEELKKEQMAAAQVLVEVLKYLQIIQKNDGLKSTECENNLAMFKAISHLQEDFDVFVTPAEYTDPAIRKQIQEHYITAFENIRRKRVSKSKDQASNSDRKAKSISTEAGLKRLGRQLQKSEQELWSDLALRALGVGKVDQALQILRELYEHHSNSSIGKVLFTAAKTLCQMLEADVLMVLPEGLNLPLVIHSLACQALTLCHSDLLLDCLELCKCTRITMDVYHQCQLSDQYSFIGKNVSETEKDSYSKWSFQDVFNEDCIVLDPVSVLPVQYEITNCLLPLSRDTILYPLDCSCLSHCSFEDGSEHLFPLLKPLGSSLQMLQECSQLELALRVLLSSYTSCLQHCTSNVMDLKLAVKLHDADLLKKYNMRLSEIRKMTISFKNAVVLALLNKVFNWRVVDCELAIGLCTLLSKSKVIEILWKVIDTWQNYDRISAVAKVGANFCCLYADTEEKKKFLSVITDAEWGIKLSKLEISIQSVFRQQMKSQLIPVLAKNSQITPDIILQYCSTYGLDQDTVINQYITTLLLLQGDQEEGGRAGDMELSVGSTQEQPLCHRLALERVLQIMRKLHSVTDLTDSLCAAVFKLSPYNYERIEVVLKILQVADENVPTFPVNQAMALLQHLKSYKRVSALADIEHTYLFENNLPPNQLSQSRLPFHLLMQTNHYWKIITPELTEETFPTLLLISKLMTVCLDTLYVSAANHVFEKKMKPFLLEQRKRGQAHGYNKAALDVAKAIMKYIHCIQSPEWAAATAHRIAQELPPGNEKTQSLRFCLTLGEVWLKDPSLGESARSRGETFLSKVRLQFQRSATENALIASRLNSQESLKLTRLPAKLIVSLYEHSSVEQRYRDSSSRTYPDLHAVIKDVASINNVDLLKISNMLLEKWICKTGPAVAKEMALSDCESIEDDPDLMRVVYMLQACPMDKAVHLLTPILSAETWPLRSGGPRLTVCHRTRALLCLVRLTDAQTLETHTHIPRYQIQFYLKCYAFVSQLEALNIPYTVQSFLSCPKDGLVKGLWKNHSHEPQAVRLVADLCLEYQVYDPQLWDSLLQKLLGFNLIGHLQKVLDALVAVPSLWEISSFPRTWRSTILAPFVSASVPVSPDQQSTLYRTFVLLLKCPVVLNMDLTGIANRFAQLNLPAFALGTLLLIPCAQRKAQQAQGFLSLCDPLTVLDQVEELMNTGELAGIPSQIRETALIFLCDNGQQQKIIKTRHLFHLRDLLLSHGQYQQVRETVQCLLTHDRQEEAASLAREYMKYREPKGNKVLTNGSASPADCIKDFLSVENGALGGADLTH